MSKLIYVDKLKKDILDLPNCYNGFSDTYDKSCIIGVIDEQPTIEERKWIPCSERLPETNGEYLVTRASANLYCYIDIVKKTNVSGDIANDIVAWMPLPEPAKLESE